MNIVKEFDLAIKLAETGSVGGGYLVGDREYDAYMTKAEWKSFMKDIDPQALAEYGAGGGSELTEKGGKPPKMASYGSSSRMIYLLSRHVKDFHFEKKLHTTVGGTANLDGFLDREQGYVFVEAKCHEPYCEKNNTVSEAYRELYEYINEYMPGALSIKMKDSPRDGYMEVEYEAEGEKLERFDLKQMICHFLGIATGMLRGKLDSKQIDFIYLLYDPTDLELSKSAHQEIDAIYERTCYECNLIDFPPLLDAIFRYLRDVKQIGYMSDDAINGVVCCLTFSLASQEFYPLLIG